MTVFTSFTGRTRALLSDEARKADFNEIPIISLAAPEDEIVDKIRDACTRVGFMYIKDHNVPQDIIGTTFNTAEKFFSLPSETKNEINYKKSAILRGYEPAAEVRTDETKKPDLNEAWNCGYEADLDPLYQASENAGNLPRAFEVPDIRH